MIMEQQTPSSLERLARDKTKSLATIGGIVVAAYTFLAGAIIWSFSGKYTGGPPFEVTPIQSRSIAKTEKSSGNTLADSSGSFKPVSPVR
jgi:hypothetical protein